MKMSSISKFALALALPSMLVASPAMSTVISSFSSADDLGLAIPDDGYDGTLPSMASSTIGVAGPLGSLESVEVWIDMSHTWVGDLTIKLQGPSGTVVTLLSRPGMTGGPDDGTGGAGDSSNLLSGTPITYRDNSINDAEGLGSLVGGGTTISSPDNYFSNPDEASGNGLAGLIGELSVGDWILYIGDSFVNDPGTLDQWKITLRTASATVPEPASMALFGFGLLGLGAMRRRRRTA